MLMLSVKLDNADRLITPAHSNELSGLANKKPKPTENSSLSSPASPVTRGRRVAHKIQYE